MKLSKLVCTAGFVIAAGVTGIAGGSGEAWGEGDSVQRVVGDAFSTNKFRFLKQELRKAAKLAEAKPGPESMLALHQKLVQVARNLSDTAETLQGLAEAMNVASVRWGEGTLPNQSSAGGTAASLGASKIVDPSKKRKVPPATGR